MKVIVTGAAGHIGYNVALQLIRLNYPVIVIIRSENENIAALRKLGAEIFTADLFNPESYAKIISEADVMFHLASENTTDTSDFDRVIANTFELTKVVVETALAQDVKTIIYTSSVVVLGRSADKNVLLNEDSRNDKNESPYVTGKMRAEDFCRNIAATTGADIRIVYPSWVIGGGDVKGTPPHKLLMKFLTKGEIFKFKGGISIAHADDVALGHINAWLRGKKQGRYVLAGNNITFESFYEKLAISSGKRKPYLQIPKPVIVAGAYVLQFLLGKKNPVDPGYAKAVLNNYSWYNSDKAIQDLNYKIRDADEIIKSGIDQANGLIYQSVRLTDKKTQSAPVVYDDNDILLITGFPGWLSNRMVDIMINGDYFGKNKIQRNIRLLVMKGVQFNLSLPANFELYYGDLNDRKSLEAALDGVNTVYHLAGVIYPKKISLFEKVNRQGTINLVDACIEKGVRRFLFMSTDSVCGYTDKNSIFSENEPSRPYKNYGRSKFLAEEYVFEKTSSGKIDGTILRGFWFFGPFAPERNKGFINMMKQKYQIVFGNGKNKRTISHTDNLTDAFLLAEKNPVTIGHWYWIGDGSGTLTVDEIYRQLTGALNNSFSPVYIPGFICEVLSLLDTILGKFGYLHPTIHAAGKFHKNIAARSEKAAADFGYYPSAGFEQIREEVKKMK